MYIEAPAKIASRSWLFQAIVIGCSIVIPVVASSASARQTKAAVPLEADDLLDLNSVFGTPALSSDGQWVAYSSHNSQNIVLGSAFGQTPKEVRLTVQNLKTGKSFQLGDKDTRNGYAVWSPDSRWLAYFSDRDGELRLWGWDNVTGEHRRLSAVPLMPLGLDIGRNIVWTPDGKRIITQFAHPGFSAQVDVEKIEDEKKKRTTSPQTYRCLSLMPPVMARPHRTRLQASRR